MEKKKSVMGTLQESRKGNNLRKKQSERFTRRRRILSGVLSSKNRLMPSSLQLPIMLCMSGTNPQVQFHLVNANHSAIGGVLFQLQGVRPEPEASPQFGNQENINLFFFLQAS